MDYKTIDDLAVRGKRVLVRAVLNVPLKDGVISDATRLTRQAPTIRELAEKGARVIVLSHFDRPKGKVVPSMSLKPVVAPLAKAIGRDVAFAEECAGPKAEAAVAALKDGDVLLLENTRFHPGEEKNDPDFAKQVAALRAGHLYVQVNSEKAPNGNLTGWLLPPHPFAGEDVPVAGPGFLPQYEVKK
jgi:phosphoglycerate kinase